MARVVCFMVIASIEIAVFLGLAVYVVTRNPRQPISWVLGAFCFTVANHYVSSLFLFPGPELSPPVTPFFLRWKWVTISFSPTFYLHLASFYFPPAWRRYRLWVLSPAYLFSAGLAMAALFTDLLVAGPLYRSLPYIIGVVPGPLMRLCTGFFVLEVTVGIAGLIAGYRAALSPSFRRQIVYLLTPTGLVVLGGVGAWSIVLTKATTGWIPFELIDVLLIFAAFFYVRAVLLHGSFVGRPLARRDLFYSTLGAVTGLVTLYLTITLDHWLATYTPFPYPLATGILVAIVAVGFPAVSRWVVTRLDGLLFRAERQQREVIYRLAEALVETPDPEELQAELLGTLCAVLGVCGGYVALSDPDSPLETLTVRVVLGNLSLRPGDPLRLPPLYGKEPQLVSAVLPPGQAEPIWQETALFCPLPTDQGSSGVLALGEKQDGTPFTPQELTLCAELARRLDAIGQMVRLREQRNHHLEMAHLRDQALRRLEDEVIASTRQTLAAWGGRAAPLEIRLLGPLQVVRDGQPVPEAAWGTERAKALLAYLLWKGPAGATREEISMALWPGRLVEETANVFHVTLHHLRRVLEPELGRGSASSYVLYEGRRYCFNASAPHWLDVTAFQALVADGKPAALQEAVTLYRGPYLEDGAWALPPEVEAQRRELELLYANALRRLAAQAGSQEAVLYLTKLLAVEPTDETAHHALVLGYLARGRRDLARRQVARWQQALDELDLEPSPEATALWQMVENGGLQSTLAKVSQASQG